MSLARFYIAPETIELKHDFWLHDESLRKEISKNLHEGDDVILFDGINSERLYKLTQVEPDGIHLEMVTEFERKLPKRHIYLLWALQSNENDYEVISKCTEIGVSNFVPLIAEGIEISDFDMESAVRTAIEASEKSGRSDIPHIRGPLSVEEAISEYKDKIDLLVIEVGGSASSIAGANTVGIIVTPQNGWSDKESELLKNSGLKTFYCGDVLPIEVAEAASRKLL